MAADSSFKDLLFAQFNQLAETFKGLDPVFWRTGNSLDASIHFLVAAQKAWGVNDPSVQQAKTTFQSYAQASIQIFRENYLRDSSAGFKPGNWWDDYGWWGIAALNAYENFAAILVPPINPNSDCYQLGDVSRDCCLQYAMDAWTVLSDFAWTAANEHVGPNTPPVSGGCWNNYFKEDGTGGVQNTVTNVLFLTLSTRLYLATAGQGKWKTQNQAYLNAACSSYRWFGEWFIKRGIYTYRSPMPDELIYWLLERPALPNNPYNKTGEPPYTQEQKWTGDQGIFLGGLAVLLQMKAAIADNPDIQALSAELQKAGLNYTAIQYAAYLMMRVAQGCRWFLTYDAHVLHEGVFSAALIKQFGADYATGKGALMRYLGDLDATLKPIVNFQDCLRGCAVAIGKCPPTPANGYGFIWDNNTGTDITAAKTNEIDFVKNPDASGGPWDFVVQTARLDALTAAVPFLST